MILRNSELSPRTRDSRSASLYIERPAQRQVCLGLDDRHKPKPGQVNFPQGGKPGAERSNMLLDRQVMRCHQVVRCHRQMGHVSHDQKLIELSDLTDFGLSFKIAIVPVRQTSPVRMFP